MNDDDDQLPRASHLSVSIWTSAGPCAPKIPPPYARVSGVFLGVVGRSVCFHTMCSQGRFPNHLLHSTFSWMCTTRAEAMVAIGQAVVYELPPHAPPMVHGRRAGRCGQDGLS